MNKRDSERLIDLFERLVEAFEKLAEKEPNQVIVNPARDWLPVVTTPTTAPVPGIIPNQGPLYPGIQPWKPYTPPTYPGIGGPFWTSDGHGTLKFSNQGATGGLPGSNFGGLPVVTDPSVEPGTVRVVQPETDTGVTVRGWASTARSTADIEATKLVRQAEDQERTVENLIHKYRKSVEKDLGTV